ncbi:MAG TPA: AsmA-like C-terminal region-containing protein [Bacteroidales bacterium]|nr:hypothetical protein [Bacteroidales bacterium]HRC89719.1 AsmA-like C-terminal region-containing protein [Bacteroidales bacterium]
MKLAIKILFWCATVIIILSSSLIITAIVYQDKVVNTFIEAANKRISTRTTIESHKLSLLRRFPKASIELKNVTVFSSASFDKSHFKEYNTDTLLNAGLITLEFSLPNIVNGNYLIESTTISDGTLNLFSDTYGGVNYAISSGKTGNGNFAIDLEKVIIKNLEVNYYNKATNLNISGKIGHGKLRSKIAGTNIDFICSADIKINEFKLYSTILNPVADISVDVNLSSSGSEITFRKGIAKLEGFSFDVSGYIHPRKDLFLKITGNEINLSRIKKYIPQKYLDKVREYSPGGIMKAECIISGPISRTKNLKTDISFSLEKGNIYYKKSDVQLKNLCFSGTYTNGKQARPETTRLDIKNCSFDLGSASWLTTFSITDFKQPVISGNFSGDIIPAELLKFIKIPGLISAEGSMKLKLELYGPLRKNVKYSISDFPELIHKAQIGFDSFGITHSDDRYSFNNAYGNIVIDENLQAEEVIFSYKGQRFKIDGEFINLLQRLAGRQVNLRVIADISASDFNPSLFVTPQYSQKNKRLPEIIMPSNIETDINLKIGNFIYNNFRAENLYGKIVYKPGRLNFRNFSANTLDGVVDGNFILAESKGKSFLSQGIFRIENIDIKKCFASFNNFGQNFLRSEHISGLLSGTFKILIPLDSLMHPIVKTIVAEGKYTIQNGALTAFEPARALSKYIDIKELENISFSKIENNLLINNYSLSIPQMDIYSSAADFTINGTHSFDNIFEYHVKIYLSELLSGKIKKKKQSSTEFGYVEDDGLGRTSLFLKITGKGENVKVMYDIKAAENNIRKSFTNEKSNLKNILNQEYGWYENDTSITNEAESRPKFKIEWSETDNSEYRQDTVPVKKENTLNRIFRKIKINNQ